jgi:hypothetical protein
VAISPGLVMSLGGLVVPHAAIMNDSAAIANGTSLLTGNCLADLIRNASRFTLALKLPGIYSRALPPKRKYPAFRKWQMEQSVEQTLHKKPRHSS